MFRCYMFHQFSWQTQELSSFSLSKEHQNDHNSHTQSHLYQERRFNFATAPWWKPYKDEDYASSSIQDSNVRKYTIFPPPTKCIKSIHIHIPVALSSDFVQYTSIRTKFTTFRRKVGLSRPSIRLLISEIISKNGQKWLMIYMLQFNMYSNHYELGCIFGCNRLYYSWNKSKTCYQGRYKCSLLGQPLTK